MPKLVEGYNMLIWENEDGTASYSGSLNRAEWDRYLADSGNDAAPDVQVPEDPEPEGSASEQPAGNASGKEWLDYAKGLPNWDDADAELGRNELRDKYGSEES